MDILSVKDFNQKVIKIFNKKDEIITSISDDSDRWDYDDYLDMKLVQLVSNYYVYLKQKQGCTNYQQRQDFETITMQRHAQHCKTKVTSGSNSG